MTQAHIENLLKETMGLDPVSIGSTAIETAIRSRMAILGFTQVEEYWKEVSESETELQELIEMVVVPETWFFRDEEAFSVLARTIFKDWLPTHPTGTLRLLSAPCCTGEEPYSMVMALLDAGFARARLHIDAVDISKRALRRARMGLYGANSFRSASLGFRERYFERGANGYSLTPRVRELVNVHHANLVATNFPASIAHYDVVFCRNVLIYFDGVTQERLLQRLSSLLAPNGLLFVGPAEAFLAASNGFKSINESMSFAFRKANGGFPESLLVPAPQRSARRAPKPSARRQSNADANIDVIPPCGTPTSPLSPLESARRLADAGRLMEAGELCEAHLKKSGASVEVLYVLGLVKDALGDARQAGDCYRKVLYLEPTHTEALVHLALLMDQQGDVVAAMRLRERARRNEMAATR